MKKLLSALLFAVSAVALSQEPSSTVNISEEKNGSALPIGTVVSANVTFTDSPPIISCTGGPITNSGTINCFFVNEAAPGVGAQSFILHWPGIGGATGPPTIGHSVCEDLFLGCPINNGIAGTSSGGVPTIFGSTIGKIGLGVPQKVCSSTTPVDDTSDNTEHIVLQCAIPQGTMPATSVLRIKALGDYLQNATAGTAVVHVRLGTAGTTADTIVYQSNYTEWTALASRRAIAVWLDLYSLGATNSQQCALSFGASGGAVTTGTGGFVSTLPIATANCAASVKDMAAGGTMYLSLSWTHSTANATQSFRILAFDGYLYP